MKKKLIIVGVIVLLIASGYLALFVTMDKKNKKEQAELLAHEEIEDQLNETIKALEKENGILEDDNSTLQNNVKKLEDDLKDALAKIEEMVAKPIVVIDAKEFKSKIQDISELATLEYRYTNVGIIDAKKQFTFWDHDIPLTGKTAIIVMDGTIKVGIDCSKVDITCNDTKKEVIVKIPEASILSNELDENSLQVRRDEQSIFNKFTQEDHNNLRKQIKTEALENAKKGNVLELADERAQLLIKDMIESLPNVKGNYEVKFEIIS